MKAAITACQSKATAFSFLTLSVCLLRSSFPVEWLFLLLWLLWIVAILRLVDFKDFGWKAVTRGLTSLLLVPYSWQWLRLKQQPTTGPIRHGLGTKSGTFTHDWPCEMWWW